MASLKIVFWWHALIQISKDDYHKKGTVSFEEAYKKLVSYLRLQNLYEDCVNFAFKLFTNFIRSLFLGAMLQ